MYDAIARKINSINPEHNQNELALFTRTDSLAGLLGDCTTFLEVSNMWHRCGSLASAPALRRPLLANLVKPSDHFQMLAMTMSMGMGSGNRILFNLDTNSTSRASNATSEHSGQLREQYDKVQQDNKKLTFLISIKSALEKEKKESHWLVENFNLRQAMDYIVIEVSKRERIEDPVEIKHELSEMTKQPAFAAARVQEVESRKLVPKDVDHCIKNMYHEVWKHTYGNNGTIVIRNKDGIANEVAALVTIFRVQDELGIGLVWREVSKS
ncbi:hypothetical protein HOY82DRAFT_537034 [Tuber indicum]|nr:hypothetical protein HOY82DRAFT_537034 [Tuber indicum]